VVHADGTVSRLAEGGPVLGVFDDAFYEGGRISIASGDRIVFFTDGVTEARNAQDEEFGEDRLIAAAVADRACSAPALQARLADQLAAFAGDTLHDDATLIVVAVD
jgi:sigma-B regulation protein RsbU (phosphoserine phosphatase)